jgi:phage gp37-like protein
MIAAIEDGLVDTIKSADPGYKLGTIASYGGELAVDEKNLALLIHQFPAVWVTFQNESDPKPVGTSRQKWSVEASFLVLVAARSGRGERFARHGANNANEIGAYQIIKDMRLLLLNQDLDLAIERFKPGGIKTLFNKKLMTASIAAYSCALKTKYVISQPAEANQPDWLRVGFNYYLKPGDDIADASDLLTLRAP